jgi:hypothetical protein
MLKSAMTWVAYRDSGTRSDLQEISYTMFPLRMPVRDAKTKDTENLCLLLVPSTWIVSLCWCPNLLLVCNNWKANIQPIKNADTFIMFLTQRTMNSLFDLSFKPLEPQINSRHKLQNSGFKLRELQNIFRPFISNKHKRRKNYKRRYKEWS